MSEELIPSRRSTDAERVRLLRQLRIDDSKLDESLQNVVEQVGRLYETNICMINLVYETRSLLKFWYGELPPSLANDPWNDNDTSFCTYVVENVLPLVVTDLDDPDHWQEPFAFPEALVRFYSSLGVRFYAGLPLVTRSGIAIGTLCLLDTRPQAISADALESLQLFAAKASAELELVSQNVEAAELRDEIETTSRFATLLCELTLGLQCASDLGEIASKALDDLKKAANLQWIVLASSPKKAGELPEMIATSDEKSSGGEPGSNAARPHPWESIQWSEVVSEKPLFISGAEGRARLQSEFDLAALPVHSPRTEDTLTLIAARKSGKGWSAAERFLLEGAARILGSAAQRVDRLTVLEQAAFTDNLTGLSNRRAFDGLMTTESKLGRVAVMLGDLAGFKTLNDTLGHPVGDLCLKLTGEAISSVLRPEDRSSVFRYGGDEFIVVVPIPYGDATALGARIQSAVATAVSHFEGIRLRLDIGSAMVPDEAASIQEALALADSRMYAAKRSHQGPDVLSGRERQVINLIIDGKRTKEISFDLGISEPTVATHRSRALRKLSLRDTRELFAYALRNGMMT